MKPRNQWNTADVIDFVKGIDKKTWLVVISGAAGILLLLVFLILPAWIERPLLRRDLQSMESQIRQVEALSKKRSGWEENQSAYGAVIVKAEDRLFTSEAMGLILGQISKMASESRVDVIASKPFVEKSTFPAPFAAKYHPKGYEFTVQGGYHDLARFVSLVESHPKLLRIQSLQVRPSEKETERHFASIRLWAILSAPTPENTGEGHHAKK